MLTPVSKELKERRNDSTAFAVLVAVEEYESTGTSIPSKSTVELADQLGLGSAVEALNSIFLVGPLSICSGSLTVQSHSSI